MADRRFKVTERLYIDAGGAIVPAGDPSAAFLFATPGSEIPMAQAVELGLVKAPAAPAKKQAPKPADKSRKRAPANKARSAPASKSSKG